MTKTGHRWAVCLIGARMHYAVPRILDGAGLLERLFTDLYAGNKRGLTRLIGAMPTDRLPKAARALRNRDAGIAPEKVVSFDGFGVRAALARKRVRSDLEKEQAFAEANARFCRMVLKHGLGRADAIYAYNGAGLELFAAPEVDGRRRVLEQTIAPARLGADILSEEAALWPGWSETHSIAPIASPLADREEREWELADQILCPSPFVRDCVAGSPSLAEKCVVVPYGVDLPVTAAPAKTDARDRPLRVLFAGEVGLRKGAPWLLEALRKIGPTGVEARFAGAVALRQEMISAYSDVASFIGVAPRDAMAKLYEWADVLALPSQLEGSATVVYEAVAHGVPVICTPNVGAIPGPMIDIVPMRDVDALVDALLRRKSASDAAPDSSVAIDYGFDAYRKRLLTALEASPSRASEEARAAE